MHIFELLTNVIKILHSEALEKNTVDYCYFFKKNQNK